MTGHGRTQAPGRTDRCQESLLFSRWLVAIGQLPIVTTSRAHSHPTSLLVPWCALCTAAVQSTTAGSRRRLTHAAFNPIQGPIQRNACTTSNAINNNEQPHAVYNRQGGAPIYQRRRPGGLLSQPNSGPETANQWEAASCACHQ